MAIVPPINVIKKRSQMLNRIKTGKINSAFYEVEELKTIDSLFTDFETIKQTEGLTTAIEYLALHNQHLLAQEDPSKEDPSKYISGTLTRAIETIEKKISATDNEKNSLTRNYELGLLDFLKTIKAYNLECKKTTENKDFKGLSKQFLKNSIDIFNNDSDKNRILTAMALNYLGLATRNSGKTKAGIEYMNLGLIYTNEVIDKGTSEYMHLARIIADVNIRWNIAATNGNLEGMKEGIKAREEAMNEASRTYKTNENYLIPEYMHSLRKTIRFMEDQKKTTDPDYNRFKGNLDYVAKLDINHGFLGSK